MTSVINKIVHRANERGLADHGWLKSYHSFSFADYYDPQKMGFGLLRVLNNDYVAPAKGFGTHAHNNMEIISIPLKGELKHQDSMNNVAIIKTNDVQIMSAGSGITHSEYNNSESEEVEFLQIWVYPKEKNIQPRYDQKTFNPAERVNKFELIVSPQKNDDTVWINQDAYFSLASYEAGKAGQYFVKQKGNGVYLFVLNGQIALCDELLTERDAIGLSGLEEINFKTINACELLLMEIPMERA